MKFQPDKINVQSISGYGEGWIGVGSQRITTSVVISSAGDRFEWHCPQFESLTAAHFDRLAEMPVELVIFGSGGRIRFPEPAWLASLMERRIGVETMDTPAACRTYNFLAGEGRKVVVALLLEETQTTSGSHSNSE